MKKIRVLHVYKTSLPASMGGVEIFIDTLCRFSLNFGIESTVFSLAKNPKSYIDRELNYSIIQAKQNLFFASTGFSFEAFSRFKILAQEADIIHYHFPNPFADILQLTCRIKKPTIVTYHSDIVKQKMLLSFYKPLMNAFLQSVDKIIATSPQYLKSSQVLQRFKHKVSVIPLGIDMTVNENLLQTKIQHWQSRLPSPFFLFVGVMRYYKGLHIALDAVENTNLHLVLAGKGGIEESLRQKAKEKNLKNVHFLGEISAIDKAALLILAYAFVFPSHLRSEAFGIALLEAASYGNPLITCEIGTGTSHINLNKETGIVIQPGSIEALRSAMIYLLDNPGKALQFGQNAKKRYKTHFTAQAQAAAYDREYRKLLSY